MKGLSLLEEDEKREKREVIQKIYFVRIVMNLHYLLLKKPLRGFFVRILMIFSYLTLTA